MRPSDHPKTPSVTQCKEQEAISIWGSTMSVVSLRLHIRDGRGVFFAGPKIYRRGRGLESGGQGTYTRTQNVGLLWPIFAILSQSYSFIFSILLQA